MAFLIGLSGGHHESAAIAYDTARGELLPRVRASPINPHNQTRTELLSRLETLLSRLAKETHVRENEMLRDCEGLVLSLPGAGTPDDWRFSQDLLCELGLRDERRFRVADDTWAGLFAHTLSEFGICAFAGTGASVYVASGQFVPDKYRKIDGWGPVIGDFGSAFQLVTDYFRQLGRTLDERPAEIPHLFDEMRASDPSLPPLPDVQGWFDELYLHGNLDWRVEFASLARVITRAADRTPFPDPIAVEHVRKCAIDMAKSISIAIGRFAPDALSMPLVLQGGMFRHCRLYRETALASIPPATSAQAVVATFEPVYGALLMASGSHKLQVLECVEASATATSPVAL